MLPQMIPEYGSKLGSGAKNNANTGTRVAFRATGVSSPTRARDAHRRVVHRQHIFFEKAAAPAVGLRHGAKGVAVTNAAWAEARIACPVSAGTMDGLLQAASDSKLVQEARKHVTGLLRRESMKLALAALALASLQLLGQHLTKALAAVQTYGVDKQTFLNFSSFTNLCTTVTTTLAATACTVAQSKEFVPAAPIYFYVIIAISGAVASAFESKLGQLSIPVDLSWQCFIVVSVMAWQMGIMRMKYSWINWLVSFGFIVGCIASVLPWGTLENANKARWYHTLGGMPLALLYLGIQGLNQTFQEKLFREFGTTVLDQVLFISLIASSINITGFLLEQHVLSALNFFLAHPLSLLSVLLLSIVGACMVFLMSYMLQLCGALICVMIHQTMVNRMGVGVRRSGTLSKVLGLLGSLVMVAATLVTMFQLGHHHKHSSEELLDTKEICLDDLDDVEFNEEDLMLNSIAGVHYFIGG